MMTNDEVVAVDQAGHPAVPLSQATPQQVWYADNGDGTTTVALFNLGTVAADVTASWQALGLSPWSLVRDLWSHRSVGLRYGGFTATVPAHGSRLLRVRTYGVPGR